MTRSECGSITPLLIGFALIVAGLVSVVVDASAGYLQREGLNSVADAAALAATDGVPGSTAYADGLSDELRVDLVAARRAVSDYLVLSGATGRYNDLTWAVSLHDRTVLVRLRARLDLPLPFPGVDRHTSVTGSSSAVVSLED